MAIQFDINDPKNQRLLAMILVPIVAGYAFFNFVIKERQQSLQSIKAQVTTMQQRVDSIKRTLEAPEKLKQERVLLEARYEELDALLPTEEDVSQLLDQFASIEQDARVYMVGFEAAETVEPEGAAYRANRYRLTIESGFHQFSEFLSYAMSLPRILSFSNIIIQPNTDVMQTEVEYEGLEDQPRTLTVECMLTSYIFTGFDEDSQGTAQ